MEEASEPEKDRIRCVCTGKHDKEADGWRIGMKKMRRDKKRNELRLLYVCHPMA